VAAVVDAVEAEGVTVYAGGAPDDPAFPYCVVFSDAGRGLQTALDASTDHYVHTFQTTCVGRTQEQAMWAAERVQSALSGVVLSVSGWECYPVRHIMSGIVGRDYDAPTDINTKYDQWRYTAVPE
jgi:hypothetical protein